MRLALTLLLPLGLACSALAAATPRVADTLAVRDLSGQAAPAASSSHPRMEDYIIVFERGFETPDRIVAGVNEALQKAGAVIKYRYHTVIKGFAVSLPPDKVNVIEAINHSDFPFVIEHDQQSHPVVA